MEDSVIRYLCVFLFDSDRREYHKLTMGMANTWKHVINHSVGTNNHFNENPLSTSLVAACCVGLLAAAPSLPTPRTGR